METLRKFWFDIYSKYDPFILDFYLPFAVMVGSYCLFNLPFVCLDLIGCPKKWLKYKMQPTLNVPVTIAQLRSIAGTITYNMLVLGGICNFVNFYLRRWRGCPIGPELPTIIQFVRDMFFIYICLEVNFYYSHRLCHSKLLYTRVHKQHHEWTAPISLVSMYCHPLEYVISNHMSIIIGPLLCGSHTVTSCIWYMMAFWGTTCRHSGYKFPFSPRPDFHDYHHEKFNENFGILEFLDYFHGTSKTYIQKKKQKLI